MNPDKLPWESKKWSIGALGIIAVVIIFSVVVAYVDPKDIPMVANAAILAITGIAGGVIGLQGINDQKKLGQ
ncbi:MAG: hypothetical protein V3V24_09640 [Nitrospinaceae bacterium]